MFTFIFRPKQYWIILIQNNINRLFDNVTASSDKYASTPDKRKRNFSVLLLPDEAQNIHPIRYKDITAKEVHKTVINTKGGSGPLGLDADGWHRISASNCFGDTSADFRRVIVSFTKKLCSEKLDASPSSLSSKVLRLTSGCNKYI